MPRKKSFIYSNSDIRVGEEPGSHRSGTRQLEWFDNSENLWDHIDWNQVNSYIDTYCHGTSYGAKVIEKTLNVLDKYTGKNGEQVVRQEDMLAYGITQDLITNLHQLNLGDTGSAQSLLKYTISNQKEAQNTAQNAGFSFEKRFSEFVQRLAGKTEMSEKEALSLRAGGERVYAGESVMFYLGDYAKDNKPAKNMSNKEKDALVEEVKRQLGIDFKNLVTYVYKETQREIDGKLQPDIAVATYKVPQKVDIEAGNYMTITSSYGSLVQEFLNVISNARLSLKNTGETMAKLGSTNDNTRLRSFVSQFVNKINKNFATICTFIFASKKSENQVVKKYLDWARILYELLGTGQYAEDATGKKTKQDILVDYLVVNHYTSGKSGKATVFNVKDLLKNIPQSAYNPPFSIYGSDHTGEVMLNLNQITNFNFS